MRFILLVVILVCAVDAFSAAPVVSPETPKAVKPYVKKKTVVRKPKPLRGAVAAGIGLLGERSNDNRSFEPRTMYAVRGGVEWRNQEILLEVAMFSDESGSSGVNIKRNHEQVDLWYRYLFLPYERNGHPFIGAAVGLQRDRVKTEFFGSTSDDTGKFEPQASVGGGYRINLERVAALWIEGRLVTSSNYEPKVIPSGLVTLGAFF